MQLDSKYMFVYVLSDVTNRFGMTSKAHSCAKESDMPSEGGIVVHVPSNQPSVLSTHQQ